MTPIISNSDWEIISEEKLISKKSITPACVCVLINKYNFYSGQYDGQLIVDKVDLEHWKGCLKKERSFWECVTKN